MSAPYTCAAIWSEYTSQCQKCSLSVTSPICLRF